MRLFRKSKKHTIEDPTFGNMEFRGGSWVGKVFFQPEGVELSVCLSGDEVGPNEEARQQWSTLDKRYQSLKPQIASALLKLYREHFALLDQKDLADDFPQIRTGEDVWSAFSLILIAVHPGRQFDLTYCFSGSNDDSLFVVSIKDETVACEHVGD